MRVELGSDAQVLVDEGVVEFSAHTRMPVAQVVGIVEQLLVVGAHIQVDGDDARGIYASGCRVDGELADGNVGAVHSPVPDAEDLFGVGDDQQVHVVRSEAEALERGSHVLDPVHGQVDSAGAAVVGGPLLDGFANGRVVDDGKQLGDVVDDDLVVEDLVAVVELFQVDVLVEVVLQAPQLLVHAGGLLVQSLHRGGKPSHDAEAGAFRGGERGSPVRQRISGDLRFPWHRSS